MADLAAQWVQKCVMKRGSPAQGLGKGFGIPGQVMDQADQQPNISAVIDFIVKEQSKMSPGKRCTGSQLCVMYDEVIRPIKSKILPLPGEDLLKPDLIKCILRLFILFVFLIY